MRTSKTLLWMLAALAAATLLGACGSDETAPNDDVPALDANGAAGQAGMMAVAVAEIADVPLTLGNKESVPLLLEGMVTGTVNLDFTLGGADADHAVADLCWARTGIDTPLHLILDEDTNVFYEFGFDINAAIDQANDSATLNTNRPGIFRAGSYEATWEITDLVVEANSYPDGGVVVFTVAGYEATVSYEGSAASGTATVTVGTDTWTVNLANGTLQN